MGRRHHDVLAHRQIAKGTADLYGSAALVEPIKEQLILARETHLDQLADKLDEDRVRRVIEPLLRGDDEGEFAVSNLEHGRDIEYVRDLGLIARQDPVRMANPIYAEVVPRELSYATQARLVQEVDVEQLMGAFQASEHWLGRFDYQEAGPQLLLQAFLQRIVNGGGRIEREYGLGYGRTDLLIVWPFGAAGGVGAGAAQVTRTVIECKVLHRRHGLETTIAHGLEQTAGCMDRCVRFAGGGCRTAAATTTLRNRSGATRGERAGTRMRPRSNGSASTRFNLACPGCLHCLARLGTIESALRLWK